MTAECFKVSTLTKDEIVAIKNLSVGQATEHQQVLALATIVKKLSRAYDVHFIPGSPDSTAFMQGRGFVGQKVMKYVNTPLEKLKDVPDETE